MARWRVGRKLGRTLYRDEVFVGTVDTPEIAKEIVVAMNEAALAEGMLPGELDAYRQRTSRARTAAEIDRMRQALQRILDSTRPGRNIHELARAGLKPQREPPR